MIKLIIFDWDDVIVLGSKKGYYDCYRETINELGVKMNEEEMDRRIQSKWGQPFRIELAELLKERPELLDRACEVFYNSKFKAGTFIKSLNEVKGANETILRLSKKYTLAIATGNHKDMVKKMITQFHIPDVFSQIVTSHDDNIPPEKTKPDPYMVDLILKEQNVNRDEVVYVGDADNDVLMAKNANVKPIVVLTGHLTKEKAEELGVQHIISDVTKIEQVLENI